MTPEGAPATAAPKLALPRDPDVQVAAALVIGSVLLLVVFARVFRDVQPA